MTRTRILWIVWVLGTLIVAALFANKLFFAGNRTAVLPGQTAGAHHQIEVSCDTCHTSGPFASAKKIKKDINKTCVTCHKEELAAADDSHPLKKFTNPRMASYWEKVDGRFCTTCHAEHQPEITAEAMVTLQGDFCVACHSEGDQDIRKDRASHADLTFDTCASSGCHNYHDNRALYEDFLVKHAGAPWVAASPVHPTEALAHSYTPVSADQIETYLASIDAPADVVPTPEPAVDLNEITHDWAASSHAAADVNCSGCHAPEAETQAEIDEQWTDIVTEATCASCHKDQMRSFSTGKHGMRRHPKVAKPRSAKDALKFLGVKKPSKELQAEVAKYLNDPTNPGVMTPDEALIHLNPEAAHDSLTCATCHTPHRQDTQRAAVEACTTCHVDDHTAAYFDSPHYDLWQAELAGDLPAGSGVTCATCHMPKSESRDKVVTDHNQTATLRPNEKMIRPVCQACHSLGFAIDALADDALIQNNFSGQPSAHIPSIDWALDRVEPPTQGANQ